jgi:hypothetical protein
MFDTYSEAIRTTLETNNRRFPANAMALDAASYKPDPGNYLDVIAPLPVFDATFADHIACLGLDVAALIADSLDNVFAGSVEAMLEWQEVPSDMASLIALDCDGRGLQLGRFFCRPDFIVGPDGPRVLEVNFGPSNGSLALVDTVQTRFAHTDQGRSLAAQGVVLRPPCSMRTLGLGLTQVLRRASAGTGSNHLLVAVATIEEACRPKGHITDFCNGLTALGFRVTLAKLSDIDTRGIGAQFGPDRVDAVYCMCTFAEMRRADVPEKLLRDLIRLDRAAEVDFIGGPAHLLFDNKANLALVHDPVVDPCFDPARLAFVRKHIPPTCLALGHGHLSGPVIYKPVDDFGGFGITFDPRTLAETGSRYIAQEIVRNTCLWVDEKGQWTRHLCFGPSFVGGLHASTLLRAKSAVQDVPIINAAQGAAVGPVLIREKV